jgi:KUP system potassium uptake protein
MSAPPSAVPTDPAVPQAPAAGVAPLHHPLHHPDQHPTGRRLGLLTLTALGVVYGDIGTSPLYAMLECFKPVYGLTPTVGNVHGVLSLIVWSLVLVVSVKYVAFILRADNKGEGGVFALLALLLQRQNRGGERRRRAVLIALGLFGGAFLYGDGIITPAISVLGAVEGLEVAAPALARYVVPIAFVIIAGLFSVQYKGTAAVGGLFGWLMLVWFGTIGTLGLMEIARDPAILAAVNPLHAVRFFVDHPQRSFVVLGAVVLVITGGEALYADMGHFGRRPIRIAWFGLVLPCLLLNYFGQGALILRMPGAVENPFYLLAPRGFVYPLLAIATLAAVVASQALISGAFSLTQQAIQLGYSPRMQIVHTSSDQAGQIYIPEVNKALAVGTLLLVVTFRSVDALGAAYGVAVTATMGITSVLFVLIAEQRFGWSKAKMRVFLAFFLTIDVAFFLSNLLKVPHGGWVPLAVAALVFLLMTTWKWGRGILQDKLAESGPADARLPGRRGAAPAAARARHRGVHDVGERRGAGGAAAPPQAQQGAARARDPALHPLRRGARRGRGGDARGRGPGARLPPRGRHVRLHGVARRAGGDAVPQGPRRRDAPHGDVVLPGARAPHPAPGQPARPGAAAAVRVHVAQRALGHRVLQHPAQPGGRAGDADRVLTGRPGAASARAASTRAAPRPARGRARTPCTGSGSRGTARRARCGPRGRPRARRAAPGA